MLMGAVILVLVSMFHGAVFSALAFWIAGSKRFKLTPHLAAAWFVTGAMLANLVLCAMLYEVYAGITILAGGEVGDTRGLGRFMLYVLGAQPFFAIALFPIIAMIVKKRLEPPPLAV